MKRRLFTITIFLIPVLGCLFGARPLRAKWLLYSATKRTNTIYGAYRPFAYRWIGAPYKEKRESVECIPATQSQINLLLLDIGRLEESLGQTSTTLHLRGRAGLLSCHSEDSIRTYKLALLLDPQNPDLELELGIAYALDASEDRAIQYEGALEHTLKAGRLKRTREFLFDSALLFQQAQLPIQAEKQWNEAEREDPSSVWHDEIRRRLTAARVFLQTRTQQISALSSPDSFLNANNKAQREGEETALDAAVEEWLPKMNDSRIAKRALTVLARILRIDHHDKWLLDAIRTKQSETAKAAFRDLALAVRANIRGEHTRAALFADNALRLFRFSNSDAGALRTRLEIIYSFDRRSLPEYCESSLRGIRSGAANHGYTWIEAQVWLEDISCRTRTRRQDVIKARKEAYDWIRTSSRYDGLGLRALGFMNEEYVSADSRLNLWRRGERGLHLFWSKPIPVLRGYSFYLTLAISARTAGNHEAAVTFLQESILLMQERGPTAIRALLFSYLGAWELEADLNKYADSTFRAATQEYSSLDEMDTKQFRQQSEAVYAEALVAAGNFNDGLMRLKQLTHGMDPPFPALPRNIRTPLLPSLGDAYLGLNQLQHACDSYYQSLLENWADLRSVHDRAQRDNALREIEPAWRGMTAVALRLHHPRRALTVWEGFRSGRSSFAVRSLVSPPGCSAPASPDSLPIPDNITFLAYAFLPGGLSGWIVSKGTVEQRWIDDGRAKKLTAHFTELVSDAGSPAAKISESSQELFKTIIGPFGDRLPQNGTIVIDADGILAGIPWSALEDRPGHPLIERFSFSQVTGIAKLLQKPSIADPKFDRALILGAPTLAGELARQYPSLPEAAREAKNLHLVLAHSVLLEGRDANSKAFRRYAQHTTLFHFAGHGISYGGFGALLLAPVNESDPSTDYMTANDISGLDLSHMQLVVLAACSSGVGEQSGIVNLDSLTQAFLEAGARRVIAANWDIDSWRTAELMSEFYRHLVSGDKPMDALRQAELAIRVSSPHPSDWAGFQVYGVP